MKYLKSDILSLKKIILLLIFLIGINTVSFGKNKKKPLVIKEQGSFAVGGKVISNPGIFDPIKQGAYHPSGADPTGQTLHEDHAFVTYQIPEKAKKLPLVFWHGYGQFSKTWQTTPDGREGFQTIFIRKGFPVYLIDQPRRGGAGKSTVETSVPVIPDEQMWFGIFRIGAWPNYYENVAFPRDEESLNQFFRQAVPSPNSFDMETNTSAVSDLFDKIGAGILVTHSASGSLGWQTAIKNSSIKAIVSYEPGGNFPFPEGEKLPNPVTFKNGFTMPFNTIPVKDFEKLTKIPIVVYYGDNIPSLPSDNPGQDQWRVFYETAKLWADVVNKHGGDVTIVHLPDIGIYGNTHFPFSDLNNLQVADELSKFLKSKNLDNK